MGELGQELGSVNFSAARPMGMFRHPEDLASEAPVATNL